MREPKSILKLIRNLLEKRNARRKEGRFVVEGGKMVAEAAGRVECVVYSENLPLISNLEKKGIPVYKISRQQFEELSQVESPQEVLAVVREFTYRLDDLLAADQALIIYCLGVQDPGNLGTIIRAADAFGANGVIIGQGTVDLYNPKVIRSTMGSIFHLPIYLSLDDQETLAHLRQKNVKIIATSLSASKSSYELLASGAQCILVGNEGAGLSEEIEKRSDEQVKIPMSGQAESLNVGVSAAIILYELARKKTNNAGKN